MAEAEDRRRILDMLAAGAITVDDAANLLKAIGGGSGGSTEMAVARRTTGSARMLRISIDAEKSGERGESAKVRVNVPLALARFASRFLPKDANAELQDQGVDLNQMIEALGDDLPDGKLVDIDVASDDASEGTTRIVIEVV